MPNNVMLKRRLDFFKRRKRPNCSRLKHRRMLVDFTKLRRRRPKLRLKQRRSNARLKRMLDFKLRKAPNSRLK